MNPKAIQRRDLLRYAACASVGTLGISSAVKDLYLTAAAAAATSPFTDYKALVCVFLYGGNDQNNVLVPRGSDYALYSKGRTGLALAESSLLPLNQVGGDGRQYGLHPSMAALQNRFNQGQTAILANVGPLIAPTTRTDYVNRRIPLPPNLFSHDDAQTHWQTSVPEEAAITGWGGRMADLFQSLGEQPAISFLMNIADTSVWQRARSMAQLRLSSGGVIGLNNLNTDTKTGITNTLNLPYTNLLEDSYGDILKRAMDNGDAISAALLSVPALKTTFPNTGLSNQLKMVARLIQCRSALSMKRQIFFVAQGGYDTHGPQLTAHANLLKELSDALSAFYDATVEINEANNVTSFTASDFGRTLIFNGEGSDHGWGSHHFITGGAVNGARLFGNFPNLTVGGVDDTSQGRFIPTTSVDQYAATLARWFGVGSSNLTDILPNIGRFARSNLGFMK